MKTSKTYRLSDSSLAYISLIKKKTEAKTDTEVIEKALHLYNLILIGTQEECFIKDEVAKGLKSILDII